MGQFLETLSKIGHGILTVLAWICIILIIFLLMYVLNNLADLFKSMADKNVAHTEIMKKGTLKTRTTNALNVLDLIASIIDLELAIQAETHKAAKEPFNQLEIDKDVKKMCAVIHGSLDRRIFQPENEMILSPTYIETYITLMVTTKILTVYRDTNIEIATMIRDMR